MKSARAVEARGDAATAAQTLKSFLEAPKPEGDGRSAVSLFSGAGLSDLGYEMAGFRFLVQVEAEVKRARLGEANFPRSTWIVGDVRRRRQQVIERCGAAGDERLALLCATPPCQGMSSSNPSRGKRRSPQARLQEQKNRLILELAPIAQVLQPRVIVAENVRPILTLRVRRRTREACVVDFLREGLPDYELFQGVIDVADYGIPQTRKRAIVVAVHREEAWLEPLLQQRLLPWPEPGHAERPENGRARWLSVREWFEEVGYQPLDAKSAQSAQGSHPLHRVPHYDGDRYLQVSQIPPLSGQSAYQNDTCPHCLHRPVSEALVDCPSCGTFMRNRPYRLEGDRPRLIKGFHSSYRRMSATRPAPTITTNTSHIGSDFKIHPWENRVLSTLECADIQTVPRFYDWSPALDRGQNYLIRNVIGEAFPTYFTYLHGLLLKELLNGAVLKDRLARSPSY